MVYLAALSWKQDIKNADGQAYSELKNDKPFVNRCSGTLCHSQSTHSASHADAETKRRARFIVRQQRKLISHHCCARCGLDGASVNLFIFSACAQFKVHCVCDSAAATGVFIYATLLFIHSPRESRLLCIYLAALVLFGARARVALSPHNAAAIITGGIINLDGDARL